MLVRFIAVGLIGLSVLDAGSCMGLNVTCITSRSRFSTVSLRFIPFLLGVVVLVKARAVAEWISNKFDA